MCVPHLGETKTQHNTLKSSVFLLWPSWKLLSLATCGSLKLWKTTTKDGGGAVIGVSRKNNKRWERWYTVVVRTKDDKLFPMLTSEGQTDSRREDGQSWGTSFGWYEALSWRQSGECVKCGLLMACLTGQSCLPSALYLNTRLYVWEKKGETKSERSSVSVCLRDRHTPLVRDRLKARDKRPCLEREGLPSPAQHHKGPLLNSVSMESSRNWDEVAVGQGLVVLTGCSVIKWLLLEYISWQQKHLASASNWPVWTCLILWPTGCLLSLSVSKNKKERAGEHPIRVRCKRGSFLVRTMGEEDVVLGSCSSWFMHQWISVLPKGQAEMSVSSHWVRFVGVWRCTQSTEHRCQVYLTSKQWR